MMQTYKAVVQSSWRATPRMGDDDDDNLSAGAAGGDEGNPSAAPAPDAVREDMVNNAVAFLKHPQVNGRIYFSPFSFFFLVCFFKRARQQALSRPLPSTVGEAAYHDRSAPSTSSTLTLSAS